MTEVLEATTLAPSRSPRLAEAVVAARELLELEGPDGFTMRRLAERMGIRAPSLYKHVGSKEELEALLIADVFREIGQLFHDAVARASKGKALAELGRAYRTWALAHPHLYRLVTSGPLPRERLPEGLEAWAAEPVVIAAGGDADRARAAWAFAHGMTILELDRRFPPNADLDAAWTSGIGYLAASGLASGRSTPRERGERIG
jgi:AcrR family transcriptional regulator